MVTAAPRLLRDSTLSAEGPERVEAWKRQDRQYMNESLKEIKPNLPKVAKRKPEAQPESSRASSKYARRGRGDDVAGSSRSAAVIDLTGDEPVSKPTKTRPTKTQKSKILPDGPLPEKRARPFRKHPPKTYLERLARATSQRMFVLGHSFTGTGEGEALEMNFDIAGSTGNIYKTVIRKVPTCDCPDSAKGNQCKHICYALVKALKAPEHLQYQLAFLSSELREIYEGSPLSRQQDKAEDNDGNRKAVEGDCPICFMEFEPDKEEIIWCQAACGNNIHKTCFNQWAASQRHREVRCVYCRSPWQADTSNLNLESLKKQGHISEDGYVNVADQLGLSGARGTQPSLY
ncbi:hypothetical protein MW887_007446 [Aspergillus wentii]|nr:hypothetical protein MW887_007446 [Aspergillus wentii]